MARRLSSGLHIASSLIEDTPEKERDNDKENAEPGDTSAAKRTGDGMCRYDAHNMPVVVLGDVVPLLNGEYA